MPEPTTPAAGETLAAGTSPDPTTPVAQSAATNQPVSDADQTSSDDTANADDFDKDRAMATIRKLREELKANAKALKDLDQLRQERKTAEDAKLSEQERLTKRASDLEAELTKEREAARSRVNRYEVQLAASRLGIIDPEAAVKLLDWESIEYDNDGAPKDVDAALTELVKERPWLSGQQQQTPRQATSPTNAATRTQAPGQRRYKQEELRDRDFYIAHRDDITAAYAQGRIDP